MPKILSKEIKSALIPSSKRINSMKKKWYWWVGLIILIYMFTIGISTVWFALPLEIAKDPYFGIGRAIGAVGIVVFSIWLMKKGSKKVSDSKEE